MKTKITSGLFAQGSFGMRKINPQTGQDIGHIIRVWHAYVDNKPIGHYPTRERAREDIRDYIKDTEENTP